MSRNWYRIIANVEKDKKNIIPKGPILEELESPVMYGRTRFVITEISAVNRKPEEKYRSCDFFFVISLRYLYTRMKAMEMNIAIKYILKSIYSAPNSRINFSSVCVVSMMISFVNIEEKKKRNPIIINIVSSMMTPLF